MDHRQLLNVHADILFTYDRHGRMVHSNSPDGRPAPRVLLCHSPADYVLRFGETVPDAVASRIAEVVSEMWVPAELHLPAALGDAVGHILEEYAPTTSTEGGPTYRFPDSVPPTAGVVQVTDENVEVARDTYPWVLTELAEWWPCFAVIRDGAAVSICFSSRIGAQANEAGVDTRPAFRGRGFASAVTAAWSTAVRSAGRIPLYSTSWENLASQAVARRLGLVMIGAEATWG